MAKKEKTSKPLLSNKLLAISQILLIVSIIIFKITHNPNIISRSGIIAIILAILVVPVVQMWENPCVRNKIMCGSIFLLINSLIIGCIINNGYIAIFGLVAPFILVLSTPLFEKLENPSVESKLMCTSIFLFIASIVVGIFAKSFLIPIIGFGISVILVLLLALFEHLAFKPSAEERYLIAQKKKTKFEFCSVFNKQEIREQLALIQWVNNNKHLIQTRTNEWLKKRTFKKFLKDYWIDWMLFIVVWGGLPIYYIYDTKSLENIKLVLAVLFIPFIISLILMLKGTLFIKPTVEELLTFKERKKIIAESGFDFKKSYLNLEEQEVLETSEESDG